MWWACSFISGDLRKPFFITTRAATIYKEAQDFAGIGAPLAAVLWVLFAAVTWVLMPAYARMSSPSPEVIREVVIYGRIVCLLSFGLFFESIWTKVLQARGDMKTPMVAQILGALTNIAAGWGR